MIFVAANNLNGTVAQIDMEENNYDERKQSILLVEDNISMINYLFKNYRKSTMSLPL